MISFYSARLPTGIINIIAIFATRLSHGPSPCFRVFLIPKTQNQHLLIFHVMSLGQSPYTNEVRKRHLNVYFHHIKQKFTIYCLVLFLFDNESPPSVSHIHSISFNLISIQTYTILLFVTRTNEKVIILFKSINYVLNLEKSYYFIKHSLQQRRFKKNRLKTFPTGTPHHSIFMRYL